VRRRHIPKGDEKIKEKEMRKVRTGWKVDGRKKKKKSKERC